MRQVRIPVLGLDIKGYKLVTLNANGQIEESFTHIESMRKKSKRMII